MITHTLNAKRAARGARPRNSIGGPAFLPPGTSWPTCSCGAEMVLFLQFDVEEQYGLPFPAGSHFTLFMCPVHNDAPEDFDARRLPKQFWKKRAGLTEDERFYELMLHPPGEYEAVEPAQAYLVHKELQATLRPEMVHLIDEEVAQVNAHPHYPGVSLAVAQAVGIDGLKVGGQPCWLQDPVVHLCCCGAEMRFLCQIPDEHEFAKLPSAPEQDNRYPAGYYNVFLGNAAYVFACEAGCDTRAVHVVVDT